jgi:integrase/recombinase XerD
MQDLALSRTEKISTITHCEFNARLISLWLYKFRSPHTRRAYETDIKEFLIFVDDRPLNQVTFEDLQEFDEAVATGKEGKPRSNSSMNRKMGAVRSLLTFGCEKIRVLPTNVGTVIDSRPVKDVLAQRILTEEQIFAMFAVEGSDRNLALLKFLYYTGARVSEACAMRWKDAVDRGDGEGQISLLGKRGKSRVVLVPQKSWRSLLQLRGEAKADTPIFVSQRGGALDESQVFRIVKAAAQKAGIDGNVSPHWMRHAHASHSMDRGAPLHLVQANLGHSNPATTGKYLHARPGDGSGRYLG